MKKLFTIIIATSLVCAYSTWFAVEQFDDCKIVLNGPQAAFESMKNGITFTSLLDEKTLQQALTNLHNYCTWKVWWAESYYLFDHLLDLWFRKLDAYPDATLRYNLDANTKWKLWQDLVTRFADPSQKATPEQIQQAFASYRPWYEAEWSTYSTSSSCDISNIERLSLRWRYRAVCEIASCMSLVPWIVTQNIGGNWSASMLNTRGPCTESDWVVVGRYMQELAYIKQLSARASIRTITNLVEQYTQNYFVWTRWQNLYHQFSSFDQNLQFVNRKVQEWTPVCAAK
jgi:hypothetical protein